MKEIKKERKRKKEKRAEVALYGKEKQFSVFYLNNSKSATDHECSDAVKSITFVLAITKK